MSFIDRDFVAFCAPGELIEMESSPKKLRAYGTNTSAVLHATGDLRLVSSARETRGVVAVG